MYINLDNNNDFERIWKYDKIKILVNEHTKMGRIGLPTKALCHLREQKPID